MEEAVLQEKLVTISNIVDAEYTKHEHLGVLAGLSGMALFKFYYSKFLDTGTHADTGLAILTQCIAHINNGYAMPTYCSGIAGMGWVMEHLKEQDFIEIDNDDQLTGIDDYLYTVMDTGLGQNDYDFLHGGIGYGYYFLKRYQNTASAALKQRYKDYSLTSVAHLKNFAETEGDTVKWISSDMKTGEKRYNLGLSHGIPSIINYLSRLYVFDDFKRETEAMLRGGINYILSTQSSDADDLSLFPNAIKKDGTKNKDETSRLAWCYGDLGIGVSLWIASKALSDPVLEAEAISILKHAAKRTSREDTFVIDAGLCHGSYGNAQLFNRMFRETGIPEFKDAALFWIRDGLEKAVHEDGYAGYKRWNGGEDDWRSDLSLLEGICGIGLTVISYLSEDHDMLRWDECLMIS